MAEGRFMVDFDHVREKFESKDYLIRNVFGEGGAAVIIAALRIAANLHDDTKVFAGYRKAIVTASDKDAVEAFRKEIVGGA